MLTPPLTLRHSVKTKLKGVADWLSAFVESDDVDVCGKLDELAKKVEELKKEAKESSEE